MCGDRFAGVNECCELKEEDGITERWQGYILAASFRYCLWAWALLWCAPAQHPCRAITACGDVTWVGDCRLAMQGMGGEIVSEPQVAHKHLQMLNHGWEIRHSIVWAPRVGNGGLAWPATSLSNWQGWLRSSVVTSTCPVGLQPQGLRIASCVLRVPARQVNRKLT